MPNICEGDQVPVKDRHPGSKFRLPFEIRPWTVIHCQGTLVAAPHGGETITRNISFFKKYHPGSELNSEIPEEWLEDLWTLNSVTNCLCERSQE